MKKSQTDRKSAAHRQPPATITKPGDEARDGNAFSALETTFYVEHILLGIMRCFSFQIQSISRHIKKVEKKRRRGGGGDRK